MAIQGECTDTCTITDDDKRFAIAQVQSDTIAVICGRVTTKYRVLDVEGPEARPWWSIEVEEI